MMKRMLMVVMTVGLMACSADSAQDNSDLVYAPPTQEYTKVCKDKDGKVVDANLCANTSTTGSNNGMSTFMWYYLLTRPNGYPVGSYVGNTGYMTPPPVRSNFSMPRSSTSTYAARPTYSAPKSYSAPSSSFRSSSPSFRSSSPSFRSSGGGFRSSGGGFRGR